VELYDPSAGTFTATGSMTVARELHTATPLLSGKVLIAGGDDGNGNALARAELYDPSAGNIFSNRQYDCDKGSCTRRRCCPTGGCSLPAETMATQCSRERGVVRPKRWSLRSDGSMTAIRALHTATFDVQRKVLVTGGDDGNGNSLASAELFDPSAGTFAATGSMPTAKENKRRRCCPLERCL